MKYKALVVEEDSAIVGLVVDAMASLEHECDVVSSQDEALKRLKANEYAYMLLAIRIRVVAGNGGPRIQNTENLLEQMSALEGRPMPPVIIMSDYVVEGLEKVVDLMRLAMAMERRGVVDVIAKPFPHAGRTLDRVIKKVLGLACPDAAGNGRTPQARVRVAREPIPASPTGAAQPARDAKSGWHTATAAAKLLMQDIPDLDLAKARSRISTAAGKTEFVSSGTRRSRRIEPTSFGAWRLNQRNRDLEREDEEDRT
jgi:CheY-like chemotaxis protein